MAKSYLVKLIKKKQITNNVWLFSFEKPQDYVFTPGQYHTIFLTLPSGKEDSRDMTITSTSAMDELWVVTKITSTSSIFKQTLLHLSKGSKVRIQGPSGGFTLRDKNASYVFLAGGIGVNVFHSIIKGIAEENATISVTLFASFRKRQDMLFYGELRKLAGSTRKIVYTLTQEKWEGEKGRISEKLIKKYITDLSESIFMIAGGQEFVDGMYTLLVNLGVPTQRIRLDYFTGY